MRDGEIVVKGCAAEDSLLAAGYRVCEDLEGIVCENTHDEVVEMLVCDVVGVVVLDGQVDALAGPGEHAMNLGVCPDVNALCQETVLPFPIKVVQTVKRVHGRLIRQQRLLVIIPQLHVRIVKQPLDNRRGHIRRLVARAEKQRNERIHHLVAKVLAEEEEAQHDGDGEQAEDRHGPFDDLEEEAEALDVGRVRGDELAGEAVCPEAGGAFAEGDLEAEGVGGGGVGVEEVEGVFEDLGMFVSFHDDAGCMKRTYL